MRFIPAVEGSTHRCWRSPHHTQEMAVVLWSKCNAVLVVFGVAVTQKHTTCVWIEWFKKCVCFIFSVYYYILYDRVVWDLHADPWACNICVNVYKVINVMDIIMALCCPCTCIFIRSSADAVSCCTLHSGHNTHIDQQSTILSGI